MDYKDATGISRISGPGLYIAEGTNIFKVRMNVFHNDPLKDDGTQNNNITSSDIYNDITVNDVPLKKWFNVMIRCEGNMVDILINGMIVKRHKLTGIRQNYNKVFLTPNNPFKGFVSDLRYWNYSLGTNEIGPNLISKGPNTKNLKKQNNH